MTRLALCLALVACTGNEKAPPPKPAVPVVADAAAPVDDWVAACEQALTHKQSPVRKVMQIIEGCRPHGAWTPILAWATTPTDALVASMSRVNAFCTKDAQMQFVNEVEEARGKPSNRPWRVLGEKCGDKVGAVPDPRFMSAPYFVLDRIARATAAEPKLAPLATALDIPLPPVSITGAGFELAASSVMKPELPRWQVTITQAEIRVGLVPTAKLGANGIVVDMGPQPYPGELVDAKMLAAKVPANEPVVVIAPAATPAQRIAAVVPALAGHDVVLAVTASGGPNGWTMAGIVPVTLDTVPDAKAYEWKLDAAVEAAIADLRGKPSEAFAHPRVVIAKDATVAHLAKLLGALAFRDARAASLTNAKK